MKRQYGYFCFLSHNKDRRWRKLTKQNLNNSAVLFYLFIGKGVGPFSEIAGKLGSI